MKSNQYDSASPSMKKVGKKISLTETPATYNKNPSPGLDKYQRDDNSIPIKFGEDPQFRSRPNPMESQIKRGTASKPTTTKMKQSKNIYQTDKKSTVGKIG